MGLSHGQSRRRSLRLGKYDYAQPGAYFVTVCAKGRACLFGEVADGEMRLSHMGEIVAEEWRRSADVRLEIGLNAFVVMPNHLHGILFIHDVRVNARATGRSPLPDDRPEARGPAPRSLGAFMAGFKSATTKRINQCRGTPGRLVWQRNYYEHIIRADESIHRIREYILNNPLEWTFDRENPKMPQRPASVPKDEPWRI